MDRSPPVAGRTRGFTESVIREMTRLADEKGMALNSLADFAGVSRAQLYDMLACNKAATTASHRLRWRLRSDCELGVVALMAVHCHARTENTLILFRRPEALSSPCPGWPLYP